MNFLAHAYLSFADAGILTGNMISDFVKGKKQFDYPDRIQTGIRLHRAIDTFTDTHPATKAISRYFSPGYRLYAGAITDVVYDYFLANDTNEFKSERELSMFCDQTYLLIDENIIVLPENFARMYPYMKSQNWLFNYRHEDGLLKSLGGLHRRAKYMPPVDLAFEVFLLHRDEIRSAYEDFFPDVKNFAADHLMHLLQK